MYNNVFCDENLFSSFIVSCIPDLDINEIRKEAYEIRNNFKSREVSNIGGYQSPLFGEKTDYKNFNLLQDTVEVFAKNYTDSKELGLSYPNSCWWMNINKTYDYNVLHAHGRSDLIGVYYISAPKDSGELVLMRNDGCTYSSLYKNSEHKNITFNVPTEEGRLYLISGHLWHFVKGNKSDKDRISVSFNLHF